jgi:hypothetical protein
MNVKVKHCLSISSTICSLAGTSNIHCNECLTSNRITSHAPGWDSHSAWRDLPPLAWPCAILAFMCFTHQTINAVKGIKKSVDEIFSPLLEIFARLIRPSQGNRSSFRNPQIHLHRTRSVPSILRNACYLNHYRMRNNHDVTGQREPFYLVTSLDHMWFIRCPSGWKLLYIIESRSFFQIFERIFIISQPDPIIALTRRISLIDRESTTGVPIVTGYPQFPSAK